MEIMRRLVQEEEGQGMVEYVLIIAVISLIIVSLSEGVSTAISGVWQDVIEKINGTE